ncbi:MAG: hypothetical protein EB084_07945 [Proteobacteria bacterium]|nr:hypothetical protein [Pseudomonadota bacterium]
MFQLQVSRDSQSCHIITMFQLEVSHDSQSCHIDVRRCSEAPQKPEATSLRAENRTTPCDFHAHHAR